ncbi:MAG: threonine-phosphate decarboxylase CobD [Treponema sp.]|jgi:threonine-phosphate decarboxylase|nr:threonine-phosphate decarboxylase CobD [Treponema sp.]
MNMHGGDIYGSVDLVHKTRAGLFLDFSVNTNPLGMPDAVKDALIANQGDFERYPDPYCRALCAAIAVSEGVPEGSIRCGNGASDIIFRLCLTKKPRQALVCAPTFSEYEKAASFAGARVIHYPLCENECFKLTERFLRCIDAQTDMIFLCNPNNPSGALIDPDLLGEIARRCREKGTTLVLDECFLPFTDAPSMTKEISPNLVIIKAFTKTFSLAGLRIGYMISSNKELGAAYAAAGSFWSVSAPAQIAALAALQCSSWFEQSKSIVKRERVFLTEQLRALGLKVFDSDANFLLFRAENQHNLVEKLIPRGILIRSCANFKELDHGYYRVCVKTHERNNKLIEAIQEVLNG